MTSEVDGVLVALCTNTLARSEVAAVHELHRGKALMLDLVNAPVATAGEDEAASAARASFWQALELGVRCVPPRGVLVVGNLRELGGWKSHGQDREVHSARVVRALDIQQP